ncbi:MULTISPECIES: hypothetical protein [unclassified Butyrivibrio]|uniref:hypothetical protein n=1 Tax=unclassified Butyrivibrio TaxID=2639466 RepID=UPI0004035C0B|nr:MULTISPECIES: hypothetical protein [unclassified Butyrivibrio]MCR5343552.1 hypothetical protein [Butyrivibrio sp.]
MSYDLSSSINKMTDLYLDKLGKGELLQQDSKVKEKMGSEFSEVYDSLQAMRTLDQTMRQSYEMNHRDDDKKDRMKTSHSALSFSKGSSRIMDMLTEQVNNDMDEKVKKALNDGLKKIDPEQP